jgi:NADH-quinone oxidoreductase subunit L
VLFVTAFYSFRMYFLVSMAKSALARGLMTLIMIIMVTTMTKRLLDDHHHGLAPGQKPHETPWVVWLPLVLLAIPSVAIGFIAIGPMVFGIISKVSSLLIIMRTRPWSIWQSTSMVQLRWGSIR